MKISERMGKLYKKSDSETIKVDMPVPKTQIVLDINSNCNQRCVFCPFYQFREVKYMPDELVHRLINEGAKLGIEEIQFSMTGEPFLNPHLDEYISAAKKAGYRYICLSTNGMEKKLEVYQKAIELGLSSIKFSIHAANAETYKKLHGVDNFDSVINIVKQLGTWKKETQKDFFLFVFCTSTRFTETDGIDLKGLLGEYVDEVNYYPVMENAIRVKGIRKYLYPTTEHQYDCDPMAIPEICTHPFKRTYVSVEGYLMPCCSGHQGYCNLVDLNTTSLADAWNSDIFKEFRRKHIENDLENTFCNFCKHKQDNYNFDPINPALCKRIDFDKFDVTEEIKKRFSIK